MREQHNGFSVGEMSQREGWRRIDAAKEKLETRARGMEKVCDVCGRRMRAWRIVPCLDGKVLVNTNLVGRFVVACDANEDGCAQTLIRAGVDKQAVDVQTRMAHAGMVIPTSARLPSPAQMLANTERGMRRSRR